MGPENETLKVFRIGERKYCSSALVEQGGGAAAEEPQCCPAGLHDAIVGDDEDNGGRCGVEYFAAQPGGAFASTQPSVGSEQGGEGKGHRADDEGSRGRRR